MKTIMLCMALFVATQARAAHSVVLTWTASTDAQTGLTYNMYRVNATTAVPLSCPSALATGGWSQIVNGIPNGTVTYTDASTSVVAGAALCYYASATLGGLESVPSNVASAVILPASPTGLVAIAH